jgi:hypothetical protein
MKRAISFLWILVSIVAAGCGGSSSTTKSPQSELPPECDATVGDYVGGFLTPRSQNSNEETVASAVNKRCELALRARQLRLEHETRSAGRANYAQSTTLTSSSPTGYLSPEALLRACNRLAPLIDHCNAQPSPKGTVVSFEIRTARERGDEEFRALAVLASDQTVFEQVNAAGAKEDAWRFADPARRLFIAAPPSIDASTWTVVRDGLIAP